MRPGRVTQTKQLRDVSVMDWIQGGHSILTELRDVREATTLASILDSVNRQDIAGALDVLVMQLHALMAANVPPTGLGPPGCQGSPCSGR